MPKIEKIRNFSCIIYEESQKEGWKEKISSYCFPCFYILHDKDVKKAHYHVLFMVKNPISTNTVQKIIDEIGGANGHFERVVSVTGYARYLCHMDNKEKHSYDFDEVVSVCGADYAKTVRTQSEEENSRLQTYSEMFEFIKEHNFYSYAYFIDYCLANKKEWFSLVISSNGRVIRDYIKSLYWMNTMK